MSKERTCSVCEDEEGGHNEDIIWVGEKSFCPNTKRRIFSEEEAEEMSEEELTEAKKERLKLVEPMRPAIWRIVKD